MSSFLFDVITPDNQYEPRPVAMLDIPAAEGRMTILPGHQPLICLLQAGEVTVRMEDGTEQRWRIGPGTLRVHPDRASLLVLSAERQA